jgi:YHS domain-containing protein
MAVDPVCGMEVDPRKAAAQSRYQERMYYFCCPGCKARFDEDPARYVAGR